jgi:hypothetical protein
VVVSLSEKYAADIVNGAKVEFTVPALAQWGRASRIGDVSRSLVARSALRSDAFFVPTSAVARTTEATFVVRIRNGSPEWVNVRTGEVDGKLVEVFGDLHEGDEVAVRGTDELRPGTRVTAHVAAAEQPPSSK